MSRGLGHRLVRDDLDRLYVAAGLVDGTANPTRRTRQVGQLDARRSGRTTARSALFQLDPVASSYPSCSGHHGVDSKSDLSLAHTVFGELLQHAGIIVTGHRIQIDHGAPWHDCPDPHGRCAEPQLAADPGVFHVRRGVPGVDKEGGAEPFAGDLAAQTLREQTH